MKSDETRSELGLQIYINFALSNESEFLAERSKTISRKEDFNILRDPDVLLGLINYGENVCFFNSVIKSCIICQYFTPTLIITACLRLINSSQHYVIIVVRLQIMVVCVCLQANHFDVIRLDIKVYHMPLHPQVEWQATPRTLDGTQTLGFLYSSKPKICRVSEGDHVLLGGNSYRMDLVKD